MQSYKYLQAIFGDKWVDWGVSVGFLLLIASWFVPRNTVDFLVDFIVTGLMLVVAIRIGCVIVVSAGVMNCRGSPPGRFVSGR